MAATTGISGTTPTTNTTDDTAATDAIGSTNPLAVRTGFPSRDEYVSLETKDESATASPASKAAVGQVEDVNVEQSSQGAVKKAEGWIKRMKNQMHFPHFGHRNKSAAVADIPVSKVDSKAKASKSKAVGS